MDLKSNLTIKKRKRRSDAWKYFEEISENIAKCKECGHQINMNRQTNGMLYHIMNDHAFSRKPIMDKISLVDESAEMLLYRFILEDGLPLSFLESKNLRNFVLRLNSEFQIPSRRHFTDNVIPKIYSETRQRLLVILGNAEYVSCTTDTWTSIANESYMAITVHLIDSNFKHKSFVLSIVSFPEKHTSLNLYDKFSSEIDKWNLRSKLVSVVHDSAPNIIKAMQIGSGNNLKCFAHLLQLCVMKSLKNDRIEKTLKVVRSVIGHFKHSTCATSLLEQHQTTLNLPCHRLIQDVSTRWNSVYYMMVRFIEQKKAIYAALIDQNKLNLLCGLNDEDFQMIVKLTNILKPFQEATTTISGDNYPTASTILPIIHQLKSILVKEISMVVEQEHLNEIVSNLNIEVGDLLKKYESSFDMLAKCSFIDPRFKHLKFIHEFQKDRIKNLITKEFKDIDILKEGCDLDKFTNNNKSSLWENYEEDEIMNKDEIYRYTLSPNLRMCDDPLTFWKNNMKNFPVLSRLATKYLSVPGSSASSERVFSTSGYIVNDLRNRLTQKNAEMLVFLKCNYKCFE